MRVLKQGATYGVGMLRTPIAAAKEDDEFLDDAAKAKLELIQRVRAENSQTIPAFEFSGRGKILKIMEMGRAISRFKKPDGTPKSVIQFRVIDYESNTERLWQPGDRALEKVTPHILNPLPVTLHIWSHGTGFDTQYEVSDKIPKTTGKKNYKPEVLLPLGNGIREGEEVEGDDDGEAEQEGIMNNDIDSLLSAAVATTKREPSVVAATKATLSKKKKQQQQQQKKKRHQQKKKTGRRNK